MLNGAGSPAGLGFFALPVFSVTESEAFYSVNHRS
jgi:hypothetical protein